MDRAPLPWYRVGGSARAAAVTLAPAVLSIAAGFGAMLWARVPVNGFIWSLAWLAAGSLVGVIFGVPRAPERNRALDEKLLSATHANTNMEQISDWLTKILVGAGLVELKSLPDMVSRAAAYMAPALAPSSSAPSSQSSVSLSAALVVYFSVEGFLGGYLIARVLFTRTFHDVSDREVPEGEGAWHAGSQTPPAAS